MFNNNKINNSRYVKNARDAHIAFGANPALERSRRQGLRADADAAAMLKLYSFGDIISSVKVSSNISQDYSLIIENHVGL